MRFLRDAVITILIIMAVIVVFGWVYARSGLSAEAKPGSLETFVARTARRLAVPSSEAAARNPLASDHDAWRRGGVHFEDECAACHDENGSGKSEVGPNMYPKVPDMRARATQSLSDGSIDYVITNGVRFTGMPAWPDHTQQQTWELVSFIRRLPELKRAEIEDLKRTAATEHHEHGGASEHDER